MNSPTSATVVIGGFFSYYERLDRSKFKLCVIPGLRREVAWRFLNSDDETHMLSRNVGKKYRCGKDVWHNMFLLNVLLLIEQLHVSATVLRHHQVVTLPIRYLHV
jgi:hypothetical protein